MDDVKWKTTFLEELTDDKHKCTSSTSGSGVEMNEEDGDLDESPVVPKLRTYKEAINALEDVSQFLEHKGHGSEALLIGSSIDRIVHLRNATSRQTSLLKYACIYLTYN